MYALAELGDQYVQLPSYPGTCTEDFATSLPSGQPRLLVYLDRETHYQHLIFWIHLERVYKLFTACLISPEGQQDQEKINNQLQDAQHGGKFKTFSL